MDEFHFYSEPDRGWAWQVPLIELPQAQFVLMSATLGDVTRFVDDLTRRNGRETAVVDDAVRPVPLHFSWAMTPLAETLEELVSTRQAPVYVVHFTQAAAVEHATSLVSPGSTGIVRLTREEKDRIAERIGGFRFGAGFGKTLSKMLRNGIGVHHAGMLPRYRRLVEQLAQLGLLQVICGTDTLGVGINVPIRTVLFTGLAKFDGTRQRILRTREFLQIAGRAGRAGFDTAGYVVVQAPEHAIENERARLKSEAKNAAMSAEKMAKKKSKPQIKKPPEGTVVWTEQTYDKLVAGEPEPLVSRMKVDNAMLINVLARDENAFPVMRRLLQDNHEERRGQLRLTRRALRLARSLLTSGVLTRLPEVDELDRRYILTVDLPVDFALNQPLAHFALAALDVLDPESPSYTLDIVSVIESVLEGPRQILWAQQNTARGEAVAEMKADGIEYEERMVLLDAITWPQPLAELLGATYEIYRQSHPWLPEEASPTSSGATAWRGRRGWCCATSPMPTARCARPCPTITAPPSSRTSRSGWGRPCGRPTPRCSTSGRRSPTPGTCGPTWRLLPMTPTKPAGERNSAATESATSWAAARSSSASAATRQSIVDRTVSPRTMPALLGLGCRRYCSSTRARCCRTNSERETPRSRAARERSRSSSGSSAMVVAFFLESAMKVI